MATVRSELAEVRANQLTLTAQFTELLQRLVATTNPSSTTAATTVATIHPPPPPFVPPPAPPSPTRGVLLSIFERPPAVSRSHRHDERPPWGQLCCIYQRRERRKSPSRRGAAVRDLPASAAPAPARDLQPARDSPPAPAPAPAPTAPRQPRPRPRQRQPLLTTCSSASRFEIPSSRSRE